MTENRLETMPEVLNAIRAFVEQNPDMRVGQTIYCALGYGDCFYIENTELTKRIYALLAEV